MSCWECGKRPAEVGLYDRWQLCRECRERMVAGLPPIRELMDQELIQAVLSGPGVRRWPYH